MSVPTGYQRRSANRLGMPVEEYVARVERGERWCSGHRRFEPSNGFVASKTAPICREAFAAYMRKRYAQDAGGYRTRQLEYQRDKRQARVTTIFGAARPTGADGDR